MRYWKWIRKERDDDGKVFYEMNLPSKMNAKLSPYCDSLWNWCVDVYENLDDLVSSSIIRVDDDNVDELKKAATRELGICLRIRSTHLAVKSGEIEGVADKLNGLSS